LTIKHPKIATWQLVLPAAALLAALFQLGFSWELVLRTARLKPREPFQLRQSRRGTSVQSLRPEAHEAGVQEHDQLLSISGEHKTSEVVLIRAITRTGIGGILPITVQHSDGKKADIRIALRSEGPANWQEWMETAVLGVSTPLLCLVLGFTVVLVRPKDALAWMLVCLLLSFSQVAGGGTEDIRVILTWPSKLRQAAIFYGLFWWSTWPFWLLLFGLYFPPRFELRRNLAWLQWVILLPILGLGMLATLAFISIEERLESLGSIIRLADTLAPVRGYVFLVAPIVFCTLLWRKLKNPSTSDVRRRLRLLLAGSVLGWTPLLLVETLGEHAARVTTIISWCALLSSLMLVVFPLSLAHVIIVQRAMDLSAVVRQGLKYAMARRGLLGIRILSSVAVIVLIATGTGQPYLGLGGRLLFVSAGISGIFVVESAARRLMSWIDQRFFRDAYKSEQVLADLADSVRSIVEIGPLLAKVSSCIVESLHLSSIAIMMRKDEAYELVHTFGYEQEPNAQLLESDFIIRLLRMKTEPLLVYLDTPSPWLQGLDEAERTVLRTLRSELVVPLKRKGDLLGLICLGPKRSEEPFSSSDIRLLQSVAAQTALAIDNSRLTAILAAEIAYRERLSAERQAADAASNAKSLFLANMSHELRTPLTAILGYSEILLEETERMELASVTADLNRVHSAAQHLLELINSVLDISKIEAGRMDLNPEEFRVHELLDEAAAIVEPKAKQRSNVLQLSERGVLGTIRADRVKTLQVLVNLLSNACKFTECGTIRLTAARIERQDGEWLEMSVEDTGIGISAEELPRLFQLFSQANQQISGQYGGTGLGLVISRSFCRLMGGDLIARSVPGQGSTFTAAIATGKARPSQTLVHSRPLRHLTVLVLCRDITTFELLRWRLSGDGSHVVGPLNGDEGMSRIRGLQPDVIIVDLTTAADPWEVLLSLESDPVLSATPTVLLAVAKNRSTGIALYPAHVCTKPIAREQLSSFVASLSPAASAKQPFALVACSDSQTEHTLGTILESLGMSMTRAVSSDVSYATIGLIICDLTSFSAERLTCVAHLLVQAEQSGYPVLLLIDRHMSMQERITHLNCIQQLANNGDKQPDLLSRLASLIAQVELAKEDNVASHFVS
jgi:signal transduction histidine kinase